MMTSRSTLACLAIQAPPAESIGASMAVLLSIVHRESPSVLEKIDRPGSGTWLSFKRQPSVPSYNLMRRPETPQ